jgi:hypothetical protein
MATAVNCQALRNGQCGVGARSRRSGTLWEDRHKASLVDAERYPLACYCYIELNPASVACAVRAKNNNPMTILLYCHACDGTLVAHNCTGAW